MFEELQRICGRPVRATIDGRQREIDPPKHAQALLRFITRLAA